MYRLFIRPLMNIGEAVSPLMPRLRGQIMDHHIYQQDYYRHFGFYVPAHHILMRLAYVLNIYLDTEADTYRIVTEQLHSICSGLGITSDTTPGKVHHEAFYTKTCLILSTNFNDTIPLPENNVVWENIRPIRCLTHPNTSMEFHVPPVIKEHLSDGLAAVAIDIPLFAYQLKQWVILNNKRPEIERENLALFISKYALRGIVEEQLDIALRNRLEYIYNGIPAPMSEKERSFVVFSEQSLVHPIKRILEIANTSRARYNKALQEIPMIFAHDYFNAVPMEIASMSTYSYWAVLAIMVDWTYPMTIFLNADQRNVTEISKVLKRVDRFVTGTNCLKYMPDEMKPEFERKYNAIKEKYQ